MPGNFNWDLLIFFWALGVGGYYPSKVTYTKGCNTEKKNHRTSSCTAKGVQVSIFMSKWQAVICLSSINNTLAVLQRRGGELSSLSWPMFIDISYNLDKNITSCNCHFTVCGVCSLQIASFISYSTAVLKYFIGCKVLWDSSKYEKCCLNGDLISDVKH